MRNFVWITFLLACVGCATSPVQQRTQSRAAYSAKKRVVVLGIDGLGSNNVWRTEQEGVAPPSVPHLDELRKVGASNLTTRIDSRNFSGPNWVAIMTGLSSHRHGVTHNRCSRGKKSPTIFELIKQEKPEAVTAAIYEWDIIGCYLSPASTSFSLQTGSSPETSKEARRYMEGNDFDFLLVHFNEVDGAGHEEGAISTAYTQAVERVDTAIGDIRATIKDLGLEEETYIVVIADHGSKSDGGHAEADEPVPFLVSGPGIEAGEALRASRNAEVAPVVASLLGLQHLPCTGAQGNLYSPFCAAGNPLAH